MTLTYAAGRKIARSPGTTVFDLLKQQVTSRGNSSVYYTRGETDWSPISWADYADTIERAARALMTLGMEKSDAVCIFGNNRPEWSVMDMAAMMAGGMSAGIYQTNSPEEVAYILNHSRAPFIVCEDETYLEKVASITGDCPDLDHIIMMDGAGAPHPKALTWQDFLRKAEGTSTDAVAARVAGLKGEDLGGLIYTSGTTGKPKAVALSHYAIFSICDNSNAFLGLEDGDRLISYLPLSHIAEKALTIYGPLSGKQSIWFARSMETLMQDITEVKPTLFFGVPRVWEKIQAALSVKFSEADAKKTKTIKKAMDVGKAYFAHERAGTKPPLGLRLKFKAFDKLFYKKIQAAIGLGEMRGGYSGAAAIAKSTPEFFNGIGMQIANVYGLSENGGGATADLPYSPVRLGSVGKPVDNFEVRIADDDEIELRGSSMFSQYLHNPEATAEALDADGWFKTGDMGHIDDDGYLFITGRKKDLIITSGGKNITPSNLEGEMMSLPFVEHAVAVGDGFNFLSALVTLDVPAIQKGLGLDDDYEALAKSAAVRDAIRSGIDAVNENHARVSQIREFRILPAPLSIDAGFLTPTMKVKRAKIIGAYQDMVDDIYGQK